MQKLEVKTCDTCDKKNVCKFKDNRQELVSKVESILPYAISEAPFTISLTCGEHIHNVRERGFA